MRDKVDFKDILHLRDLNKNKYYIQTILIKILQISLEEKMFFLE